MKKITVIVCFLVLTFVQHSFSQYDCATAIQDGYGINDSIQFPPVGTLPPVGPDYGSLDIQTRPMWGFMLSCENSAIDFLFGVTPGSYNWLYGIIIWGPFSTKTAACNNLTSANIALVMDSIQIFNPPGFNIGSILSDPGELYIYMLTTNDTTQIRYLKPSSVMTTINPSPLSGLKPCFFMQ